VTTEAIIRERLEAIADKIANQLGIAIGDLGLPLRALISHVSEVLAFARLDLEAAQFDEIDQIDQLEAELDELADETESTGV